MPPFLLCYTNEECDDIWIVHWLRWTDFGPPVVEQADDGLIVAHLSVANRLPSSQLNVAAVNKGCQWPSVPKCCMHGAAKTQADTFQSFDDAAIEIQAKSITDENGQSS